MRIRNVSVSHGSMELLSEKKVNEYWKDPGFTSRLHKLKLKQEMSVEPGSLNYRTLGY